MADSPHLATDIFPRCFSCLDLKTRNQLIALIPPDPTQLPESLMLHNYSSGLPPFLTDLARIELSVYQAQRTVIPANVGHLTTNPSIVPLKVSWHHLPARFGEDDTPPPEPGPETVLVWRHPAENDTHVHSASAEDLLVLKIVMEKIDARDVAVLGNLPVGAVDAAINRAIHKGLILSPRSDLLRHWPVSAVHLTRFLRADTFTIQWHITHACDLHCRHCYDRSRRNPLSLPAGLHILDQLRVFCLEHHVSGHVCFSGGNPFLSPHFPALYQNAAERGFTTSILGNPTTPEDLEPITEIQQPTYFQISMEGLQPHNDMIRGVGSYERAMNFLALLRRMDIPSQVMLTLTRDNLSEVLPLAESLKDLTNRFTFNRLAQVGEGVHLHLPTSADFIQFLKDYLSEITVNPILRLKDNHFNSLLAERGRPPFGGCTGFGCGAAFNFLAILPDGEVHACRKFPSPLGNLLQQELTDIYDSPAAERYRRGSDACFECKQRPVCGGCMAVVYGRGGDVFRDRDPFCFSSAAPCQ